MSRGRRGTAKAPDRLPVSEADWSDLPAPVTDAVRFLEAHAAELARLARQPGLDDLTLDFPIRGLPDVPFTVVAGGRAGDQTLSASAANVRSGQGIRLELR